jgi:YD repeat-containing protein
MLSWLNARDNDIENWINYYNSFSKSGSFIQNSKVEWVNNNWAIVDILCEGYCLYPPKSTAEMVAIYDSEHSNVTPLPEVVDISEQYPEDYRALAVINAFFDVKAVINDSYALITPAQQQALLIQSQLNAATAAANSAHNTASAASSAAVAAQATALQLRSDATQAQAAAAAAYANVQIVPGVPLRDTFVVLDLAQRGAPAATKFGYDSLGRVVWKVDAEGYPEFYEYNAFGQQVAIARYSQAMAGGQVPNPDAALTPQTIAAYDQAAQLQVAADAAAAQLANVQAARAAALANPLPHLQDHLAGLNAQLATLNAELAVLQTQYNNANIIDQWLVYGPKITAKNNEITAKQTAIAAVQAEIQRVQNGQGLTSLGTGIIQAKFDPAQLEAQYLAAQSAADQALANAQTLEAQSKGMGGVQSLTQFVYDNRGQAIRITDAEGFFETFAYDAFGRRVGQTAKSSSATKVAGGITTYTYDKRGLLLTETSPVASYTSAGTVQAATVTSRYIYDARGNRIATIEANGLSEQRRTDYTYDKLDRLVETKGDTVTGLTINATTKAASSISGRPTETIAYDACGNIVTTVDAAGAKTVFFYDELNRKVAEIDALGTYSAYQYDANGNVTRIRVYDTAVAVPAAGGKANQAPAVPAGAYRETLFAYDSLNRLVESQVTGVTTGSVSGSSWSSSTAAIRTTYQYNYLGNVAQVTDPNGNKTWSYYDKLGRKVAQVDGQNYLTKWTLDSEGNVTEERRYATAVTTPGSTVTPPTGTNNAADRITQYTYDRNGRRLSETRLNVQFHNGSGSYSTGSATIAYLYNGLGQVIRRTEATGDQTNYTYDAGGRLSREVKAQSAVNYYYDGLGNLTRNVQAAVNGSSARTTTYAYGAGGRLASMTDAGGYVHSYYYDVAGRMVLESYVRANAAGGSSTEAVGHRYDVLGRNLGQAYYVKSGSNWNFQSGNDYSTLQYNAYGDVTKIGINGLWQQENKYDAAGRVWATNSGDGVWKYYGYDKNGNQTLAVTSAGTNLAGLASITAAYAQVSQASVNGTITVYDGRNLATSVLEEGRELGGSTVQLTTTRSYNAFGEVAAETNANNATFTYTYNTMGRVIAVQSPQVSITTEAGVTQNVLPTQYFYYDKSGRLTGQRDANGNLTRYDLLAGSGYGGSKALVTKETHADGGTVSTAYNVHGDAVQVTDEVGLVTAMGYDNLGRLTQVNNPGGLIDYYGYDVLGQRLTHYNSLLSAGDKEITGYDIQGRIVSQQSFGNDTTTTSYVWSGAIATAGLGTFGGWTETTTYANGKTVIDKSDVFQRAVQHTDMGGFVTDYSYDAAGRMVQAATALSGSTSTSSMAYAYYNTGLLKQTTLSYVTQTYYWTGSTVIFGQQTNTVGATYTYDKSGNRLTEVGTNTVNGTATTWKNQSATYDALGRLKTWSEAGTATSPASSISYYYDAAGNVRRSTATYRTLDATGAAASTASTQDYWFRYDSMNRLVIDRGVLSGSTIQRSITTTASKEILYDKAGRRTNVLSTLYTPGMYNEYIGYLPGTYQDQREIYTYDAAGRLAQVDVALGEAAMEQYTGTPPTTLPAAPITGARRASYAYDGMGRLTSQKDYEADGNTVAYDRALTYNAKSQLVSEIAITKRGTDLYKSISTYDYGTGTNYALGSVLSVVSQNFKNNSDSAAKDTSTVNTYAWRDGAVQNTITVDNDTASSSNALYTTTMYYNAAGRLMSAYISDGKPRSVAYTLDENAQIIRRDETRPTNAPSYQTGSPHEAWYRFGGREMGYVGNNGTSDLAYGASIAERQIVQASNPGTFRNGSTYAQNYADFAQSYDPINSYSQGASGGSYTVRTGDSLQSIAQAVWGDANLWYKLAEANGISGNAGLIEGQVIQLPAGVIRNAHNAGTVSPYNPAEAIGDVSPTTAPKPPKKKGCGGLGMVLLAVVAVAVAIVLPEAIPVIKDLGPVVAGAISGATGSVVSQGIGLATGLQSKFSFKGVALAALGGAVGGGVGKVNPLGAKAGELINDVARGVLGGSLTQGIAVATGLQSKFDFAGVAAAAVGAGVGGAVARGLPNSGVFSAPFGSDFTSTMASAIAGAATRSAIEGSSFGTNLTRALPNAIGQAMGRALARAVIGSPNRVDSGIRIDPDVTDEITRQLDGSAPVAEATSLNAAIVASPVARSGMTIGQHLANGVMAQLGVAPSDAEIEAEIVVVASRQSLNDHRYISDGQFRPIDATARLRGWEPAQENAYVHQIAVSNMFLGHFAQPPSASAVIGGSLGVVRAFAGGAMDALSGIVDLTLDAMNPGRPGAWERNIVRGRAVTSGEIITAPVNQYIDALDALFDSDDPRLLARMAGGSLVSTGLGTVLGNTGRVGGTADVLPSIEALYQVRYAAAYERGIIEVNSDIAAGIIRAPKGQPEHLFFANRVDDLARRDLKRFALEQGHGTDLVRINQRLYLEGTSGPYRIPDLYFPQSGIILDGTLGFKTARTPQIIDFRAANNNAPIRIVRPESYGGSYWVGK